jgi:hypothetical protein
MPEGLGLVKIFTPNLFHTKFGSPQIKASYKYVSPPPQKKHKSQVMNSREVFRTSIGKNVRGEDVAWGATAEVLQLRRSERQRESCRSGLVRFSGQVCSVYFCLMFCIKLTVEINSRELHPAAEEDRSESRRPGELGSETFLVGGALQGQHGQEGKRHFER